MIMMIKKFLTIFLLFFIAVAFTTSCSPIGALLVDTSTVAVQDYIKVVPKRYLFEQNEDFIPEEDIEKVIGIFGGKEQVIKINDENLLIKIIEPGITTNPVPVPVDKEEGFPLEIDNSYTIILNYRDVKTDYPIQVVKPGILPPDAGERNQGIVLPGWN